MGHRARYRKNELFYDKVNITVYISGIDDMSLVAMKNCLYLDPDIFFNKV